MRTVDPILWSRKVKPPQIQLARPMRFGQQAGDGTEVRLRKSLRDAVHEFWHNCSLGAAKYYYVDRMKKYHRRLHIVLLSLTLVLGILVMYQNYTEIAERPPLIISPQNTDNPIAKVKFPAVALCSNKIIGKAALKKYAHQLFIHPKNRVYRYSKSEIEENLLNLGALLTLALPPLKVDFERFFRDVEPTFNITDIMFKLSSNCSSILKRCSWRGTVTDCDSLFADRLTALGFCCVFNSRYQPEDSNNKPAVLDLTGEDYGLGVVIQEERDDFAYVRRPAYGMEVLLFAGDEFPLLESGDVRMYPLPRNASIYFNVRPFTQLAAFDVGYYTEKRRGCRLHGGGFSQCLWQCRRATAAALCGCVPYALQAQAGQRNVPTCTLSELACLNKHREKFMYLYPGADAGPALSLELQDALDCAHCRVRCARHTYSADISHSFYQSMSKLQARKVFHNFLSKGLPLVNATVIRMFYTVHHQKWYRVEAHTRWHDVIVKLSNQWMVVTGTTVLIFAELVYHCTFRWLYHFIRRTRIANMQPVATSMQRFKS